MRKSVFIRSIKEAIANSSKGCGDHCDAIERRANSALMMGPFLTAETVVQIWKMKLFIRIMR